MKYLDVKDDKCSNNADSATETRSFY